MTDWKPCRSCGAMTRHDDDVCIRDPRHPRFDIRIPSTVKGSTEHVAKNHHVGAQV